MNYRPSQLALPSPGVLVQLQYLSNAYELTVRDDAKKVSRKALFTAAQLRQVTLDMRPVEAGNMKLSYLERLIVIQVQGKDVRVPDIDFIRLYHAATAGRGECISCEGNP